MRRFFPFTTAVSLFVAAAAFVAGSTSLPSAAAQAPQALIFRIPAVKIPLKIKEQSVPIVASAVISEVSQNRDVNVFRLQLSADLTGLQQNITLLLAEQLDKDDHCGERIEIQNATLVPVPPASVATVYLHVERWGCVKAFGKQQSKKLLGGNAMIPVKLTPAVEQANTELRLDPEVGEIQADGSLGELLRSGALGQMIRDKIQNAILNAMQKGANLGATLPPIAQEYATIQGVAFKDAGAGHLAVELDGQIRITRAQIQALSQQVKERIAAGR